MKKHPFHLLKSMLLLALIGATLALAACKTRKTAGGGCDCPGFGTGHVKKRHL